MPDPITTSAGLVTKYLAPTIATKLQSKIFNALSGLKDELGHAFFNAFAKYTDEMYEKQSFFSSIIFPNQQQKLKDYYYPLTLNYTNNGSLKQITLSDYPGEFITERKDIIIVDSAGMGKSTIMKHLFLQSIELGVGIPIFIELRRLNQATSILDFIFNQLQGISEEINKSLILKLIESGDFIFFLDGYDEIADQARNSVTEDLHEFKRRANKNRFILSSREQVGLTSLSDFFRTTIKPLSFDEAVEVIKKYSKSSSTGMSLIERLHRPENKPIHEFLTNPLLVSLLFKAFEYKQTIPLKKHIFYRQVYEALFENHDLSKDSGEFNRVKHSKLDMYTFELVLRALGFDSIQTSKVEYPKDELLLLLEKSKKRLAKIQFNPQAVIQDLTTRVPLFVVDGNNYRWSHKSLQEYFAALYIASEGYEFQEKVIRQMYLSKRATSYLNLFSLFSDVDPKGFRHAFLPNALAEIIDEFTPNDNTPEGISEDAVQDRRALTHMRHYVFVNLSEAEFSELDDSNPVSPKHTGSTIHSKAVLALREQVENASKINCNYQIAPKTLVNFTSQRFPLISSLSIFPEIEILKINKNPNKSSDHFTDKIDISELAYPHGFTTLDEAPGNPLNQPAIYESVNNILQQYNQHISVDVVAARALLVEIQNEIAQASAEEHNF